MAKLGKREQRAKEYVEKIAGWAKDGSPQSFIIEWRKSRTWGNNPQIENFRGEPMLDVSGCGYCKHSTALANFLRWLFPADSAAHKEIYRTGGCGVSRTIETLKNHGWVLTPSGSSSTSDAYTLTFAEVAKS